MVVCLQQYLLFANTVCTNKQRKMLKMRISGDHNRALAEFILGSEVSVERGLSVDRVAVADPDVELLPVEVEVEVEARVVEARVVEARVVDVVVEPSSVALMGMPVVKSNESMSGSWEMTGNS
jgi:hypothetical protein